MQTLSTVLPYVQIVLAVILAALILIQQRGASAGGALSGGDGFGYNTRRGAEKIIFFASIIVSILFVTSAIISLIIK